MPELPEVQTVLHGLRKEIRGKEIERLDCYYPGTLILDPELPENSLPAKVRATERRGKYILLHLSTGTSLIIHLRMTGKLISEKQMPASCAHERACIMLSGGHCLHFVDIRTFGKIIHCRTANVFSFMPALGIEPLSAIFGPAWLKENLKGRRTPIKNLLMDQSLIAGLGNIYANEILYRSRINPATPSMLLKPAELKRLAEQTKAVLTEAIAQNGTSISDFRRVDDKTGEFQNFLQIYQKELCPRGHAVSKIRQGGRSTFYCPVCQK